MRLLSISMGLVLAGCAPKLAGEWDGICTTLVGTQSYDYTLSLEIDDVKKGDVNGTLTLVEDTETPTSLSGPVDGTQDGDRVKLDALLSGGIFEDQELSIEAKIDGREINGDCQYNAQFGDVSLELDD